jgi:hypothetical protein
MNAHCQIAGQPKAPEGWRTPKRFALCLHHQNSRPRFGLRLAPLVRFPPPKPINNPNEKVIYKSENNSVVPSVLRRFRAPGAIPYDAVYKFLGERQKMNPLCLIPKIPGSTPHLP